MREKFLGDLLDINERENSRLHAEIDRLTDENKRLKDEVRKLRTRRNAAGEIYDSGADLVF